jgi:hypothetical protein
MKTVKLGGSLLMAAALFSSCIEQSDVEMHTTIHPDGTCTRIVSYSDVMSQEMRDTLWTDSSQRRAQPVPECLEISGFTYSYTQVGNGDTVTSVLTHDYNTVAEMSEDMPLQLNGVQLKATSSFTKQFRWFYTDYTFTEVFSSVGDVFSHPITDYLEDDVASFWFTGQPEMLQGLSGAELAEQLNPIESAVTNWLNDNIFQLNFDFIANHYDSVINPPISREQFIAQRGSFKDYVLKFGDIMDVDHKKVFKDFFHSDAYGFFFDETPSGKALVRENGKLWSVLDLSVPYTLTMPGKITDAGIGVCQNDTVFYPLTGERLIPHDYTISATSRVNHVWAYIVTVLLVVLVSVCVLYKRS